MFGTLLSASPALHERLHSAATATHLCAATLFAAGQCEAVPAAPVFVPPVALPIPANLALSSGLSLALAHFFALLEHAPPVLA